MGTPSRARTFDYIWILRCSGANENRSVECGMIPKAPIRGIRPLVEVVDESIFHRFVGLLRPKYGEVMVDYPFYLLESSNKFSEPMEKLKRKYPDQVSFFQSCKSLIDVPVISAQHVSVIDYNAENNILQNVKPQFKKVAVRVRVPTYDLSGIPTILGAYKSLLSNMSKTDFLLLDVFTISGYESQIDLNIRLMSALGKKQDLCVFVLNAFEPANASHNYGPLFSYRYALNGFGDFATEKRFPPSGGQGGNKILRYYYWTRFMLREYRRPNYDSAASALKASRYWSHHLKHIPKCNACTEVQRNLYNESHSFWKKFRVLHYINSITNETRHHFAATASEQDLDPDGYDTLYNTGRP